MRFLIALTLVPGLSLGCKTAPEIVKSVASSSNSIETEDQLPACDAITVGRVFWVRSLDMQMLCAEGETWKPRQVDPDGKADKEFGPRGL